MQPTNQKKRKVVAYCRVSTAMQGSGLEAQVRQVRQYCNPHFNAVVDEALEQIHRESELVCLQSRV
jgi:predicted site-specific integrase-resolvase